MKSTLPTRSFLPLYTLLSIGLLALLAVAPARAGAIPSVDDPLRTGSKAPADGGVVIGIEDYVRNEIPDVPYAARDAQAFNDFLVSTRGVPTDRVRLIDSGASATKIRAAVTALGESVHAGGVAWVYFAGHGGASLDGGARMVLGDDVSNDPETFDAASVRVAELERLAGAGGGRVMIVVDACYTGVGRSGTAVLTGQRAVVPGGYTALRPAANVVWTAASAGQTSGPFEAAQHGAFTYFALGALRGWADGDIDGTRDGSVTMDEAQSYVQRALRSAQITSQTPELVGARDLVLSLKAKEAAPVIDVKRSVAVATPISAPVVVPRSESGGSGGGGLAADIAALQRAKAMVVARDAKLAELSVAKAAEGATAWRELSAVLSDGSAAEKSLVEKYIATWTAAKVWVDDAGGRTESAVAVAEVDTAKGWLGKYGKGWGGSDWTSPTLGTMKWIPAGTFMMGSPETEAGRYRNESQHSVTLTKGYWLMEHEVTQGEWQAVMGLNPSMDPECGATCPVEQVSWDDAVAFAKKASARDGVRYALPSEAEWEYAARGGQDTLYSGSNEATATGWILDNSGTTPHAVCGLARNAYGLCDMSGNVWEWTSDWYGDYGGNATDPTGASTGSHRVNRGGSWANSAREARVANHAGYDPAYGNGDIGFRLSRSSP